MELIKRYMTNKYKKSEGYTEGASQSLVLSSEKHSLMRLLWRGYCVNILKELSSLIYLFIEVTVCMYFSGMDGLVATAVIYPLYQIFVSNPVLSLSSAAATYIHKELEVGHQGIANAYLLAYVILATSWSALIAIVIAPLSSIMLSSVAGSSSTYATRYMALYMALGGFAIVFNEGIVPIHAVEHRYFLMLVHCVTRILLKGIFLLVFYCLVSVTSHESSDVKKSLLVAVPAIANIVSSIVTSVWILTITCQKTIYSYPLKSSLNLLRQTSYVWQWKVFNRVLLLSLTFYLRSLYDPIIFLVSNVLVSSHFTNATESILKRISFLFFFLGKHIFSISSRSFASTYYYLMQKQYFHRFYQATLGILIRTTLLNCLIALLLNSLLLFLAPTLVQLIRPVVILNGDSHIEISALEMNLFISYSTTTMFYAAAVSLMCLNLDLVFAVQYLQETYLLNCAGYAIRICLGVSLVLIIGLINGDNANIEKAFLVGDVPVCALSILVALVNIYEHVFLARLETFYALTTRTDHNTFLADNWANIYQKTTDSITEKKEAYKYLRFISTGKSNKEE